VEKRSYFEWLDDLHVMDLDEYLDKWRGVEKPKKEGICPELISVMSLMKYQDGDPGTDKVDHVAHCPACQAILKLVNAETPDRDLSMQLLKEVRRHQERGRT
jgi:hypothetical protein